MPKKRAGHPDMPKTQTPQDLAVIARGTRYPLAAFLFVQRGLDFTVRRAHGEMEEDAPVDETMQRSRHVNGQTLCFGLRDYALQEYGLLARTVLRHWNIHSCEDFGSIVFAMVESGMMAKTDDDNIDDFYGVFTFGDAFRSAMDLTETR